MESFGIVKHLTQAQIDAGEGDALVGLRIAVFTEAGAPTGIVYESGPEGQAPTLPVTAANINTVLQAAGGAGWEKAQAITANYVIVRPASGASMDLHVEVGGTLAAMSAANWPAPAAGVEQLRVRNMSAVAQTFSAVGYSGLVTADGNQSTSGTYSIPVDMAVHITIDEDGWVQVAPMGQEVSQAEFDAALAAKMAQYQLGHPYATAAGATHGHTVTQSSNYDASYAGWKAFSAAPTGTSEWAVAGTAASWLSMEFPQPVVMTRCALKGRLSSEHATRWALEGSTDGTNFTMLLDKTAADASLLHTLGEQVFDFPNLVPYKHYRFRSTVNTGSNPGLNSIRWSHQGINFLPVIAPTMASVVGLNTALDRIDTDSLLRNGAGQLGDATGWAKSEGTATVRVLTSDATQRYSGDRAMKIAAGSDTVGYSVKAVPVVPGKTYSVRVALRSSAVFAAGLYIRMQQRATLPTSGIITDADRSGITDLVSNGGIPAASLWDVRELQYTVPAGVYWVSPSVLTWTGATADVWFDFQMTERDIRSLTDGSVDAVFNTINWDFAESLSGGNLNTLTQSGFYDGDNMTGAPSTGWYYVIHQRHSNAAASTWHTQIAIDLGSPVTNAGKMYTRTMVNGTFQAWSEMSRKTDLTDGSVNVLFDTLRADSVHFLATSYDLNTLAETGWHNVQTPVNGPGAGWWYVFNGRHRNGTNAPAATYNFQLAMRLDLANASALLTRVETAGTWSAWSEIATKASVDTLAKTPIRNYLSTLTYALDEQVFRADVLYRCSTAITVAEAWNPAKWTEVSAGYAKRATIHVAAANLAITEALHSHSEIHLEGAGNLTLSAFNVNSDRFGFTVVNTDAAATRTITPSNFAGVFLRDGDSNAGDLGNVAFSIPDNAAYEFTVTDDGGSKYLNIKSLNQAFAYTRSQTDAQIATAAGALLPKASLVVTPVVLHPENFAANTATGTAGTYTVSASSEFSGTYAGRMCFDSSDTTDWATSGVTSNFWVRMTLPVARIVTSFIVRGRASGGERMTNWRLEASNDGTTWISLLASTTPLGNTAQTFTVTNATAYLHYRMFAVAGETSNPGLSRLTLRGDSYAFANPVV